MKNIGRQHLHLPTGIGITRSTEIEGPEEGVLFVNHRYDAPMHVAGNWYDRDGDSAIIELVDGFLFDPTLMEFGTAGTVGEASSDGRVASFRLMEVSIIAREKGPAPSGPTGP